MVGSRIPQGNYTLGAAGAMSSLDVIAIHVDELSRLKRDEWDAREEASDARAALAHCQQLVAKLQAENKRLRAPRPARPEPVEG